MLFCIQAHGAKRNVPEYRMSPLVLVAYNFNRRGEIRDLFTDNQHLRMMNLNLLTAIIIYWNTKQLGIIAERMKQEGRMMTPKLLKHISPLGWEHIIITGFYKW